MPLSKPTYFFVLLLLVAALVGGCIPAQAEEIQPAKILQVHFIDVGQGDAILIISPDRKAALIDGGEARSGALQYLKSQGVRQLEWIVVTHPHEDHIGGLPEILQSIPTAMVATNGQPHTTVSYERLLDAIIASQAEYREVKRGDTIALGNLVFEVLSPGANLFESMNENSVVLRLVYGNTVFLFMGDAEQGAEADILASGRPVDATVLKAAHHGSRSSSSPEFVERVRPAAAVYFAGAGNQYGHPHTEALETITSAGAQVYGTDRYGSVMIQTDGMTYHVRTEKSGAVVGSSLSLEITSFTTPVAPGGTASLSIKTVPGATGEITVYTKSGPSQAQGLEKKVVGSDGTASWTWRVGSSTQEGNYPIRVRASLGGEILEQETTYTVKK